MNKIVSFVLVSIVIGVNGHQCTYNSTKQHYQYDFTEMRDLGDLTYSTGKRSYYFQVCSETVQSCSESSICYWRSSDKSLQSAGLTEGAVWSDREDDESAGVEILYSNGSLCESGQRMQTIAKLQCLDLRGQDDDTPWKNDHPVGVSYISDVDDSRECLIIMTIQTPFACPKNSVSPSCKNRTQEECYNYGCYCRWHNELQMCTDFEYTCPDADNCTFSYGVCYGNAPRMSIVVIVIISTTVGLIIGFAIVCITIIARRNRQRAQMREKHADATQEVHSNGYLQMVVHPPTYPPPYTGQVQYLPVQYYTPTPFPPSQH